MVIGGKTIFGNDIGYYCEPKFKCPIPVGTNKFNFTIDLKAFINLPKLRCYSYMKVTFFSKQK